MRLIDADKLYPDCMTKKGTLAISQNQIANAPTVEPFERIGAICNENCGYNPQKEDCGKWIFHENYNESIKYGCNKCGNLADIPSNFCPNCGAKMEKGARNVK